MAGCLVTIADEFRTTPGHSAARAVIAKKPQAMRTIARGFVLPFLTALCVAQPAFGLGYVEERIIFKEPSLPKGDPVKDERYISCYDIYTLRLQNCSLTRQITGIKDPRTSPFNNGGHNHGFDSHPLIHPASGALQFSGTDTDPAPLVVRGQTQNTEVKVTHPLPRVAGKIMVESTLISPPRWFCAARCFTLNSWKDKDTIDVGMRGLVALFAAPSDDFVFKPSLAGDTHPQANYGTERLVDAARIISKVYREKTNRKPRITDMSLPKGGMFDLNNQWFVDKNNGHVSHHTGNDVDFSALDDGGQSINCFLESTRKMKDAFGKTKATFKQCYKNGHYHIRFP